MMVFGCLGKKLASVTEQDGPTDVLTAEEPTSPSSSCKKVVLETLYLRLLVLILDNNEPGIIRISFQMELVPTIFPFRNKDP